jgi:hypothetical protein
MSNVSGSENVSIVELWCPWADNKDNAGKLLPQRTFPDLEGGMIAQVNGGRYRIRTLG